MQTNHQAISAKLHYFADNYPEKSNKFYYMLSWALSSLAGILALNLIVTT